MTSRGTCESFDEIGQYIDRLREERRLTEHSIRRLEHEKGVLEEKIEDLKQKRDAVDVKLQSELERAERQDRGLKEAEATYNKLMESKKSLVDFVKKEYQDTKRSSSK
ncbi:unnamed protein product [Caenorhabditis bovis]|uniref:Uncharacterized protein n=1 Tax=Caenorhabditis bovis TaxID=2654633 RepID=A0A8S1EYA4_9PELO|nr:unnamed protein product [Caenorhabditis bovis]CAB3406428.1 unnamed protein product [Caenorhabditis bovis]